MTVRATLGERAFAADLTEAPIGPGARALLVDCPPLYDRAGIYNERGTDYPDNAADGCILSKTLKTSTTYPTG